jgi:RHS repeat-associated protein
MTNESGSVVWSAAYTPFGKAEVDGSSTQTNNFRFPGQYYDAESGLHYNWHRYYDPKTGRYLTADPIGLDGGLICSSMWKRIRLITLIHLDFMALLFGGGTHLSLDTQELIALLQLKDIFHRAQIHIKLQHGHVSQYNNHYHLIRYQNLLLGPSFGKMLPTFWVN